MDTLAYMKQVKFDYSDGGIMMLTAFDRVSQLDTESIEGYMILACDNGQMSVGVNGKREQLGTYEALILPPKTRLSNFMASADVRCDLSVITVETAKELLRHHIEEWDRCLYLYKTNHIFTTEESRHQFMCYVDILSFKIAQQQRRYNREIVRSIMRSILFDYLELMMSSVPKIDDTTPEGQHKILFKHFMELLTTRHVKHQLVDTYAQELCVSPNYLIKVCKEVTGKTALQWIREYTEADIRYYLLNSDMSVKEICNDLGFPNLSFFGRYCRRAFGMSPNELRNKMKQ